MKEKLWTAPYLMALAAMFGMYLTSSILLSLMAVFARNITGSDGYAGLMTSVFTLGALAVRFLAGGLIDRFGSRKVVLSGLVLVVAGSALLIGCGSIALALVARTLQGIGFGFAATATSTVIASVCPPSRLLDGISYSAVAQSLTAVLGPSIGFWIVGESFNRFPLLFIAAVVLAVATFVLMFFEKQGHGAAKTTVQAEERERKIIWTALVVPVLVLFLNSLTQSAIVSFLALYAISLKLSGIGAFFSVNAVGMIASRFIMNRLVRRFGEFQMILANTALFAVSVFLLTHAATLAQLCLLAFPAGFAMGSVAPIVNTHLLQRMPAHRRGLANAVYFSTLDLGYGLGSVAWGLVAVRTGYLPVFFMAAGLQAFSVAMIFVRIATDRVMTRQASTPIFGSDANTMNGH